MSAHPRRRLALGNGLGALVGPPEVLAPLGVPWCLHLRRSVMIMPIRALGTKKPWVRLRHMGGAGGLRVAKAARAARRARSGIWHLLVALIRVGLDQFWAGFGPPWPGLALGLLEHHAGAEVNSLMSREGCAGADATLHRG